MKKALITGVTGQDGSYLCEFLLDKGYEVHGVVRRASSFNTGRIDHLYRDPHELRRPLQLHYGDMTDVSSLRQIIDQIHPDEVYNLGAQSHVKVSFIEPQYTADVVAIGTLRLLQAVCDYCRVTGAPVRFYQAGSSEMFGGAPPPQNESTPFCPRSPYAVSKVAAHWFTVNFREAYGLFACNGILFNHESPRRGETFVTRKITRALTRIKLGLQSKLYLGNLEARRDWGFAGDYVEAMWMMLQRPAAGDYVVATGESYSVRDFLDLVAQNLDMDWRQSVVIDPELFRPTEVDFLQGDASRAQSELGWRPRVSFAELVGMMVSQDLERARKEQLILNAGHRAEN